MERGSEETIVCSKRKVLGSPSTLKTYLSTCQLLRPSGMVASKSHVENGAVSSLWWGRGGDSAVIPSLCSHKLLVSMWQ